MSTGETVAVKKVLQDKQYMNRELDILKDLVHPNIVALKHHFFTQSDKEVNYFYIIVIRAKSILTW